MPGPHHKDMNDGQLNEEYRRANGSNNTRYDIANLILDSKREHLRIPANLEPEKEEVEVSVTFFNRVASALTKPFNSLLKVLARRNKS